LLEDNPDDAELILTTLKRAGMSHNALLVNNRADFCSAIENEVFDLILSDFCLPSFDGFSALDIFSCS
jgi:CheY-like chemotaxis protein